MASAATAETASVQVGDTRLFKYGLIAPAVFLMILVAVLPLAYLIVVSFQRISLSDEITSFEGLVNYARIFSDARLWNAVLHTSSSPPSRCRSNSCSACCLPTISSRSVDSSACSWRS
ncbi:MAG: hypothetical protein R3D33_18160 [Hyphomicrobiaceae bacterium]